MIIDIVMVFATIAIAGGFAACLVMLAWSLFEETKLGSMFIERLKRHEEDE